MWRFGLNDSEEHNPVKPRGIVSQCEPRLKVDIGNSDTEKSDKAELPDARTVCVLGFFLFICHEPPSCRLKPSHQGSESACLRDTLSKCHLSMMPDITCLCLCLCLCCRQQLHYIAIQISSSFVAKQKGPKGHSIDGIPEKNGRQWGLEIFLSNLDTVLQFSLQTYFCSLSLEAKIQVM